MHEYVCVVVAFVLVFLFAYIKVVYPFWNVQPVFHIYDFWRYWTRTPFYIQRGLPIRTKFCDSVHVQTRSYSDTTDADILVDLLQCHYISSDRLLVTYTTPSFLAYLVGYVEPVFLSTYAKTRYEMDASGSVVRLLDKPEGCVVSRPIHMTTGAEDNILYFWDFLCVTGGDRARFRALLQTHEYNQRIRNPGVLGSFFRKEIDLCDGIVPFCRFDIRTYYLRSRPKIRMRPLPSHFSVVEINQENVGILTDVLEGCAQIFGACATLDLPAYLNLIKARQWFIYVLRRGKHTYALYVFKDAQIEYEDISLAGMGDGRLLHCLGSMNNCSQGMEELFYMGFLHSLKTVMKEQKQKPFQMLMLDGISHNNQLLEFWHTDYTPLFTNHAAYYLYNWVVPSMPLGGGDCMILV